jgi:hypothetical protein
MVVEVVGHKLATHHPVIEPVSEIRVSAASTWLEARSEEHRSTEAALLISNNASELRFQPCVLSLKRVDRAL